MTRRAHRSLYGDRSAAQTARYLIGRDRQFAEPSKPDFAAKPLFSEKSTASELAVVSANIPNNRCCPV